MKQLFENKYFSAAVRIILGGLFIYSSLDKLANPEAFSKIIFNYKILPIVFVNALAIFLPWIELLTGVLLIVDKWVKSSLLIYTTLLVIFIIALSQALLRGLDIACGCFSVAPSSTSDVWIRIVLDIVMLFFSYNLYKSYKEEILTNQNI